MKRMLPIGLALVLLFLWTGLTFAAPADEPTAQPTKLKHDGGINDLDAIGNRNVGCNRGMGNWYSVEKQIAMGKAYSQQVESSVVVWTAIRPGPKPAGHIYVALRVPTHYTASDSFLTTLAGPLKTALP